MLLYCKRATCQWTFVLTFVCHVRAPDMRPDQIIIANLSGRGDKDVAQVADLITL